MDLVEPGDVGSVPEIAAGGRHFALATFALDGEFRSAVAQDGEVNFPQVCVADKGEPTQAGR